MRKIRSEVKEEPSDLHQVRKASKSKIQRQGARIEIEAAVPKSWANNTINSERREKAKVCGKSHCAPCKYKNYVCNQCGINGHIQDVCINKSHFNSRIQNFFDCMFSLRKNSQQVIDVKLNGVFICKCVKDI